MEARMACGLATCQTRSCGRMTSWSRSTPLVSTCWMPKSETESSNAFCRIASRSFWAMRWLGSSSESDLECSDSSQATRSMRGQTTIAAMLSTGQKVLIHAGSGGVGTVAIQLAKHLGAIVATTTSTANLEWVKRLGADIVIDYRKDDFEKILHDYDVVLNSQGGETLEKSLRVLKPGGKLISISGPPDPDFAKDRGLSWIVRLAMRLLSYRIRNKATRHHVSYSFLFMRASGDQLREIGSLIDAGIIRPVVDRVFPFEATKEALAYVETGRAKGKVVVKVR